MSARVELQIPLLRRLQEVSELIESKFPADFDRGMGQLGLLLSRKLKPGESWCTPTNSLEFASTGGDGVHFSLVQVDGAATENSPVVVSVPASGGEPNVIVGSTLTNFLRFGLLRGFFALEQLVYRRDLTLEIYSSADWQATEDMHYWVGFHVDDRKRRILELVAHELDIAPLCYTPAQFQSLQDKYMPLLRVNPPPRMW